ncbi:hypothetical protein GBA52_019546 [Prunus armeniaca]|nr:hypothetical protein GBA52_019546 [Prunus armeniaca]
MGCRILCVAPHNHSMSLQIGVVGNTGGQIIGRPQFTYKPPPRISQHTYTHTHKPQPATETQTPLSLFPLSPTLIPSFSESYASQSHMNSTSSNNPQSMGEASTPTDGSGKKVRKPYTITKSRKLDRRRARQVPRSSSTTQLPASSTNPISLSQKITPPTKLMADKKKRQTPTTVADKKKRRRPDPSSDDDTHHPFKSLLKPDELILQTLDDLRSATASSSSSSKSITLADLAVGSTCREVSDLDLPSVQSEIELQMLKVIKSILDGNGFAFEVPSRAAANQLYVPELDRIVLKDKTSLRPYANVSTVRKATITARLLQLIHQLCLKNIHVTKRDLFYTDVKLFQDQTQSDSVLDDVSCMLGCTRSSLNVIASEKGVVVGRLIFSDNGDMIDCTKMGMGGKAIPPNIDRVGDMQSDALFILLVEKDAAYIRLAEDRFYNRFPCIIVTAKGQPDVATRLFLRKMKLELKLPVLALVDSDPYGLKILSVYGCGSKNMSYDSANLTTPDIKWLGIRPSDLDKYKIPEQCRLTMTDQDIKTGKEMLEEDFVKKNPKWVEELTLMVKTKQKAEIQALSTFGFQYLSETYLPLKLQEQDWI